MKLIIGLGNPGEKYLSSRHNIGFAALTHFARKHRIPFRLKQASSRVGQGEIQGVPVILAKPYTYMNRSGRAVKALKDRYATTLQDIIIIHDDMDLPPGKIRIRMNGGSAGHKGIESIISGLGSQGFIRLRIGIGHPESDQKRVKSEEEVTNYVLTPFTPEEKQAAAATIPRASDALLIIITQGVDSAMNQFNKPGAESSS